MLLQVTQSIESIQPGGAGHIACLRVRLLHAAVRQKILKLAKQKPSYYDVERLGVPINDLDCMATIATFSATQIWLSLPRQGIWMKDQEVIDFIALFRFIAYLLGVPTDFFQTPDRAKRVMEVLMLYEIKPSETSAILASNIISSLENQPPTFASRSFLEANSRWLNGHKLCDALRLGRPGLYYYILVFGQCIFFMTVCYFYRAIPYLDKRKIVVRSRNGDNELC